MQFIHSYLRGWGLTYVYVCTRHTEYRKDIFSYTCILLSLWWTMVSPTQMCWRYHSLPLSQRYRKDTHQDITLISVKYFWFLLCICLKEIKHFEAWSYSKIVFNERLSSNTQHFIVNAKIVGKGIECWWNIDKKVLVKKDVHLTHALRMQFA